MKSPFPGMDPYIEVSGLWEDFHSHLIEGIYRAIARVLPERYTAQTGVRTYVVLVEGEGKKEHLAKPDLGVVEPASRKKPGRKKGGVAVAKSAASVSMRAFIPETYRERFVEIYEEGEDRVLVTCIEVLSPSNKRPKTKGWRDYLRKRQAVMLGTANFIEIDLLRGGKKMPMIDEWPNSPYTLLVARSMSDGYCAVWPADFRTRLPVIPVPLEEPDPDLQLDLQPLLDEIYALGRYGQQIDYTRPLKPALAEEDAAWVEKQLKGWKPRK